MLDNVTFKQTEGSLKWWFHVYRLIQTHLATSNEVTGSGDYSTDTEGDRVGDIGEVTGGGDYTLDGEKKEGEEDGGITGVVNVLEKLLEGASVGEFAPRLQMLLAFHCQLAVSPSAASDNSGW